MIVRGFAPIARRDARTLVLGSMPGIASIEAGEYYAHPRNAFWPIMGALYGAGPDLPYALRVEAIMDQGVAVWDMLQSCVRKGSLDARIQDERPNDLAAFFAAHSMICRIGLNGGKAASSFRRYAEQHLPPGVHVHVLPSTSPAHAALGFSGKCEIWKSALLS